MTKKMTKLQAEVTYLQAEVTKMTTDRQKQANVISVEDLRKILTRSNYEVKVINK